MIASGVVVLMLAGCNGSTGSPGPAGANGTSGTNGTAPPTNVATLTQDQWAALSLSGTVTSVAMTGADKGTPQVTFKVTDSNGVPVVGLSANVTHGSTDPVGLNHYPNFAFSMAKLTNQAGGATQWVSYIVTTTPTTTKAAAPTHPSSDNTGTLTEDGLGNYTYTFYRDIAQVASFVANYGSYDSTHTAAQLGDLSYDANAQQLTHRISVMVGGAYRGTSTNTADGSTGAPAVYTKNAANLIYDFIPATGLAVTSANTERLVTDTAACNACHTKLGASFHTGGEMKDVRYCVMCHTDQQKYGAADAISTVTGHSFPTPGASTSILNYNGMATGNLPAFIHRIHNGSNNYLTNFQFNSSLNFNAVTYPQDVRNCATCHVTASDAPQSANWMNKPGIVACGACHDNVNIPAGTGTLSNGTGSHIVQTNDAQCATCHDANDIQIEHTPILNAAQASSYGVTATWYQATNPGTLPVGAHSISAKVSSVKIVPISGDSTNLGNPQITFSLYADGGSTPLAFNTASSSTATNMLASLPDGSTFVGGPSLLLAMALPEDGITPADYNYEATFPLVSIWNGSAAAASAGTISGLSSGVIVVKLTGVVVPPNTSLMVGGVGEGSNLVQTNLGLLSAHATFPSVVPTTDLTYNTGTGVGGLLVPIQTVWATASFNTTTPGGTTLNSLTRRTIVANDACNSCHSNLGAFTTSSFHSQANNDATSCAICHNTTAGAHANAAGYSINAKDWVHGLHAAAFRTAAYTAQSNFPGITFPAILNNCEACHVPGSYDFSNATNAAQVPNMLWDTIAGTITNASLPNGVATGTYGTGVKVLGTPLALTAATPDTLVVSPITAACTGCHTTTEDIAHMTQTGGGIFYTARGSNPLVSKEQCLICHGPGAVADIRTVHMNF